MSRLQPALFVVPASAGGVRCTGFSRKVCSTSFSLQYSPSRLQPSRHGPSPLRAPGGNPGPTDTRPQVILLTINQRHSPIPNNLRLHPRAATPTSRREPKAHPLHFPGSVRANPSCRCPPEPRGGNPGPTTSRTPAPSHIPTAPYAASLIVTPPPVAKRPLNVARDFASRVRRECLTLDSEAAAEVPPG